MPYKGNFDSNISFPIVLNTLNKSTKTAPTNSLQSTLFWMSSSNNVEASLVDLFLHNHTDNLLGDCIFRGGLIIDCAQLALIFLTI